MGELPAMPPEEGLRTVRMCRPGGFFGGKSSYLQMNEASEMRLQLTSLAEALGELYGLLEGYAPTWYTCITIYSDDAVNTLSSLKFIADAGNGEDQLRFFGSLLQFLA